MSELRYLLLAYNTTVELPISVWKLEFTGMDGGWIVLGSFSVLQHQIQADLVGWSTITAHRMHQKVMQRQRRRRRRDCGLYTYVCTGRVLARSGSKTVAWRRNEWIRTLVWTWRVKSSLNSLLAGWLLLNEIILLEVEKVRICRRRRLVVLKSKRSDWAYRSNPLQIPINA